jgi:transketolase
MSEFDARAIAVARGLAMDAPNKAKSGHQGTAMALAPLAHVLFSRVMRYDAADPSWPDRDRFILSAGHASILLYSMLYLTGHGLEIDDLERFRQWESATPGHPEVHHTAGVEVTTGPLGQGFANSVGMALAERSLRARFGEDVCNHHIFTICGDGDLSEGVSHEAGSLAGHQKLGRLVAIYDDNHITIDGTTDLALSDDPVKRFEAYGWHVQYVGEIANDLDALEAAIRTAMAVDDRPSMIVLRSHIAYPSPNLTDDHAAHGYALFDDEIALTKAVMGSPPDKTFWCPDDVLAQYRAIGTRGAPERTAWLSRRQALDATLRVEFDACLAGRPIDDVVPKLPTFEVGKSIATRVASGTCLDSLLDLVPGLVAGGADLTGNTGTVVKKHGVMSAAEPGGRQMYYGIREHAMGSIMTGMALHGGVVPVGGTFLVFSDYMRPAVRIASISDAKVIYSFTHDSVGVGEDGPTHQPIEQVMSLRLIPKLTVIRPADANETVQAWAFAVNHTGPTALILSRQNLPVLDGTASGELSKGAYVLRAAPDGVVPAIVLLGTGSEVQLCVDAAAELRREGVAAAVVSMPSTELFDAQPDQYRSSVLPAGVPVLSIEAGVTHGWERYADASIGINRYGASAPGDEVLRRLGMTVEHVIEQSRQLLARHGASSN